MISQELRRRLNQAIREAIRIRKEDRTWWENKEYAQQALDQALTWQGRLRNNPDQEEGIIEYTTTTLESIVRSYPKGYEETKEEFIGGKIKETMPYKIEKTSGRCWSVMNTKTGKIHSKCTSKKKAEAQMRLLYGIESGKLKPKTNPWKPSNNPWIVHVKKVAKEKGLSYVEALKVASATYKKGGKTTMKGGAGVWFHDEPKPEISLTKEEMVGPVWDHVGHSWTFERYIERGYDPNDLVVLYDSIREDVKSEYPTPSNVEEMFAILKNQRRGMMKRRPRT